MKELNQASCAATSRNHDSILLKLASLMVLNVTIQIDLSYSYRYCKPFNKNPKSSSKVKICKAPVLYYTNSVKCFDIILTVFIEKNLGPGSHSSKMW